jgi:tetratricopeptide (TPR) repeat protein
MTEAQQVESDAPAADLVDLSKVRDKISQFVDAEQLNHAKMLLDQIARWPDTTRYLDDNIWLYTTLGGIAAEIDATDDALDAYRRGFELEPRELDILRPYCDLLFHSDRAEEGLEVVRSLLLHHKRSLERDDLASIYLRSGQLHRKAGDLDKARTSFEKALEEVPNHVEATENLLEVVAELGEVQEVIRVRSRMIRQLEEPAERAEALIKLGDDWVNTFNDPARALDVYEQALVEDRENPSVLEKIASVGTAIGDWRRVSRAYFTLAQLTDDPKEQADWIVKSSLVARDELWEPEKALAGFRHALDLDPTRLDAFKAVTSILVDSKSWVELEEAYLKLITALLEQDDHDKRLVAVLFQKLGELYKIHLGRETDAIISFSQAAAQMPEAPQFHKAAVELAETNADHLDKAVEHLRALAMLEPNDYEHLDRLGKVYLRMKQADRALCVYRVLAHRGWDLDEKAADFVDRFDSPMFRPIHRSFTPEFYARYVFSPGLDPDISNLFAKLKPGLEEWTGHQASHWGLKKRDKVKLEEPLVFNNIYRSVGETLGFEALPDAYRKSDQTGMINGGIIPDQLLNFGNTSVGGLIVGDDLLGSGREEYAAFVIGKQLFLFLPQFYLAALRPASDLQVFFVLAAQFVDVRVSVEITREMETVLKHLRKKLKGDALNRLKVAVDRVKNKEADIPKWVEHVEDAANRVGLVFADDLNACREYLDIEPQKLGSRTIDQRMDALLDYAISEQYFALRQELGVTIDK